MVIAQTPDEGVLSLIAPDGSVAVKSSDRHGGPPSSWFAEVAAPAAGTWHATLVRDHAPADCSPVTRDIVVSARQPSPLGTPPGRIWQVRSSWNSTNEALFSALIEKLFDAPPDQDPNLEGLARSAARPVLQFPVQLSQPRRRQRKPLLRPDCADFVYFLRAYFAFKMGLPFGYSNCSRAAFGGKPPKCYQWFDVEHPEVTRPPPPPEQDAAAAATAPSAQACRLPDTETLNPSPLDLSGPARSSPPSRQRLPGDAAAAKAEAPRRRLPNICVTPATSVHTGAASGRGDDNADFCATVPG